MSASCRRLTALSLALVLSLGAVRSAVAVDQPPGAPAPSPDDCAVVYQGSVASQGAVADYRAGAAIDCGRPGNTAPYGAASPYTAALAAPSGLPCTLLFYAPVRFQDFPRYIH